MKKPLRFLALVAMLCIPWVTQAQNIVEIGDGTKVWLFCHIQRGARIGKNCSFGQNVNVANNVVIGNGV